MSSTGWSIVRAAVFTGLGFLVGLYRLPPSSRFDALVKEVAPAPRVQPLVPMRDYMQRVNLFAASSARADVVLLGDSITEGGLWQEYLPGVDLLNRGISGDLSDGALERLPEVLSRGPKVVSLLIGTNDMLAGFEPEHTAANIAAIVERLGRSGARVVLTSVPYISTPTRPTASLGVDRLNPRIRELATKTAGFVDLNALTARDGALDHAMSYDGVHLTPAAYLAWSGALRPLLLAALAK
jgi:lysophospholipase L1-like esterase